MSSYIQLDLIVENRSSFTKARQALEWLNAIKCISKLKKHHLHDYDSYWLRVQADFQRDAQWRWVRFSVVFLWQQDFHWKSQISQKSKWICVRIEVSPMTKKADIWLVSTSWAWICTSPEVVPGGQLKAPYRITCRATSSTISGAILISPVSPWWNSNSILFLLYMDFKTKTGKISLTSFSEISFQILWKESMIQLYHRWFFLRHDNCWGDSFISGIKKR